MFGLRWIFFIQLAKRAVLALRPIGFNIANPANCRLAICAHTKTGAISVLHVQYLMKRNGRLMAPPGPVRHGDSLGNSASDAIHTHDRGSALGTVLNLFAIATEIVRQVCRAHATLAIPGHGMVSEFGIGQVQSRHDFFETLLGYRFA